MTDAERTEQELNDFLAARAEYETSIARMRQWSKSWKRTTSKGGRWVSRTEIDARVDAYFNDPQVIAEKAAAKRATRNFVK